MKRLIAYWNILVKDMRTYYLKPPNISWGLIFPLAWTGMFFIRSGSGLDSVPQLLPGVVAISILFGTTSMLAVTVTFEKKNRSFERLLLAPIPFELLMLAKTSGAILFGVANAFVPVVMALFRKRLIKRFYRKSSPPGKMHLQHSLEVQPWPWNTNERAQHERQNSGASMSTHGEKAA